MWNSTPVCPPACLLSTALGLHLALPLFHLAWTHIQTKSGYGLPPAAASTLGTQEAPDLSLLCLPPSPPLPSLLFPPHPTFLT
jgi:hypothetical protein